MQEAEGSAMPEPNKSKSNDKEDFKFQPHRCRFNQTTFKKRIRNSFQEKMNLCKLDCLLSVGTTVIIPCLQKYPSSTHDSNPFLKIWPPFLDHKRQVKIFL